MAVQRKAPLLFIAHGLGDLVVQEAAIQRASGLNIIQETDVGYIFLNTPFPNYQGSDRWDKDKYGFFFLFNAQGDTTSSSEHWHRRVDFRTEGSGWSL
jgi:hypothetical protein